MVSFVPIVSFVFLFLFPSLVYGQLPDAVGVRAQGMGGAFTAVADDANADWWNPAGLASGAFLNMIVEYGEPSEPLALDQPSHRGFALAFPALGISYFRMPVSAVAPTPTGDSAASRQDPGTPGVRTAEVSQFGFTVGQSLGNHLVVASTLKVLRAHLAGDDTKGDLDIGGMVAYGGLRAGVMVRNVREAAFSDIYGEFKLQRQARAGGAWGAPTRFGALALAFDGDLLRVMTATGEERRLALGGEAWLLRRFLGVRSGLNWSTVGETRRAYAGGLSVAVHHGVYAEGQLTGGSDVLRKGWSAGLRVTF